MSDDIQELEKEVRKLKRKASEWAGMLHDLVEDRLPAAYEELPGITEETYKACKAWEEANKRLAAATK